jgi:amino acid permease
LIVGGIYFIIIILFPEPEKIKLLAMPIFVIYTFIFLCIVGDDYRLIFNGFKGFETDCIFGKDEPVGRVPRDYFRWENTTVYLGMALYGYEAVGTLFAIRNTMEKPKKITGATISTFVILGFLYLFMGISTYLVYGNNTREDSFKCYDKDHDPFFTVLYYVFAFCLAPWMPLYIIAIFEPMEYFGWYSDWLKNDEGKTSRFKLTGMRLIGTALILATTLISNDVTVVTEFGGNLFNPTVSFLIPVFLVQAKAYWIDGKRRPWLWILHDGLIFLFSAGMMIYGTYNQIRNLVNGDPPK